ncbi:MAG TPA: HlyD family efflux transporter periplasmic adaptor subunit [Steroidobacteraceae bacterium]
MDVSVKNASAPRARLLPDRRRRWLLGLGAAIALLGLIWLAWWLLYSRFYESTDDAYVAGDMVNVMSQVSGTVVSIGADETDLVEGGQELVRLDATDARIALQDAEQQLARTVRQTHTVFATRDQLRAVVAERRADLGRTQSDFDRRRNLAASGAVSGEELGHAQDALQAARDALLAAEKNLAAGSALVGHTGVADNPDVRAAATQVERAWLALVRTSVRAPVTGYLARRSVQLGERISPGAPLMAIVPIGRLWLEANFREVQLRHMRIGQPATVVADLYGGHVTYHGHVAGLGLGTGSAFALLPAQNATGNWIKVVQRVPVRIELEPRELSAHPLRIGLSTVVTVEVRETSGPQLAQTARQQPVLSTRAFDIDRSEIRTRIEQIIEENTEHTPEGVTPSARQQSSDQSGFR